MRQELRLYTFTNMYLSSIQKGIQSAHLVHEIMIESQMNRVTTFADSNGIRQSIDYTQKNLMVLEWAEHYKTMIVCNGGNSAMLQEFIDFMESGNLPYPWTYFKEDEESLNGALTVVGIVLPEDIYDARFIKDAWRTEEGEMKSACQCSRSLKVYKEGEYMYDFIKRVQSARLAV